MISFWERDTMIYHDIVIVGSGILGLCTALEIRRKYPNASIAIFERELLPSGASTKNAGFSCFGSLSEILSYIDLVGMNTALSIIEKRWKGIQKLQSMFTPEEIDYKNYGGYELLHNESISDSKIKDVNKLLFSIFRSEVFQLSNNRLKEFGFTNSTQLIWNPLEGQLHSGKLILSLIKRCLANGIQIYNGCELKDFERGNNLKLLLGSSYEHSCGRLIFTTNGFVPKKFKQNKELNVYPGRGQVLLTKPIPDLKIKGTYHMERGFYYFRNVGNRVLLGGGRNLDMEGESTTEFGIHPLINKELRWRLEHIVLPGTPFEIDMEWSGIMAFSSTHLPLIQEIDNNVYYAMNCNGMGVSLSPIMAEEISDKI